MNTFHTRPLPQGYTIEDFKEILTYYHQLCFEVYDQQMHRSTDPADFYDFGETEYFYDRYFKFGRAEYIVYTDKEEDHTGVWDYISLEVGDDFEMWTVEEINETINNN